MAKKAKKPIPTPDVKSDSLLVGLDISTSCTGICVLQPSCNIPLYIGWERTQKYNTLWEKERVIRSVFQTLKDRLDPDGSKAFRVAYEEPLIRLSAGRGGAISSAATITTLARFNGMVGLAAAQVFGDPEPVGYTVHEARKGCRILLSRKVKIPEKEQVFQQVVKRIGDEWVEYRTKKDGTVIVREQCLDASDAWVVAEALRNTAVWV